MQRIAELVERQRLDVELKVGPLPLGLRAHEDAELRRRHGQRPAPEQRIFDAHPPTAHERVIGLVHRAGVGKLVDDAKLKMILQIGADARHLPEHFDACLSQDVGGADAVVFTAGVGEHSVRARADVVTGLEELGLVLDPARNEAGARGVRRISADGSRVDVLVVPTEEELSIAEQVAALVG